MPKYLIQGSYTGEGAQALMRDGGTGRKAAIEAALKSAGCSLESLYFAFGDTDVYCVVDAPDNVTMAGVSLATGALGAVRLRTTVLLTPQEMDAAAKKAAAYKPPAK
jgi:uncharacterized protein with GYD domain